MTSIPPDQPPETPTVEVLRPAIVLSTSETACTVVDADGRTRTVPYAAMFPRPRVDRVSPGNLLAIAATADGPGVVVWRWFDAVVLHRAGSSVTVWEPQHGTVAAQARSTRYDYAPGSRAYLSAGLPGADWWLAGPSVTAAKDADVELDQVLTFLTTLGLWEQLVAQPPGEEGRPAATTARISSAPEA